MIDVPQRADPSGAHRSPGVLARALRAAPAMVLLAMVAHSPLSFGQDPAPQNTMTAGPQQPAPGGIQPSVNVDTFSGGGGTASEMVHVPVSKLFPGNIAIAPDVQSPVAGDPGAAQRGMTYFEQMNCVGCHAPSGDGGMGPALSNKMFIYGADPANIYLTILQGRPNGMPAWGGMLPDSVIWDLVAYVQSISKEPGDSWGKTTSAQMPAIEQVPAEYMKTTEPWNHTQKFSFGQPPYKKVEGSPDPQTPPPQ